MSHDEINADDPILWMQDLLIPWLKNQNRTSQQLINWLQGYDLPPVGHEEEPYLWLLRGLPTGDERYSTETALAYQTAKIINDKPDITRPGDLPEKLLYNVLMLSAGLSCPDQLLEPLYAMFKRKQLTGAWRGVNLWDCLWDALIQNQIDNRLYEILESIFAHCTYESSILDEETPYIALALMPHSKETRGTPAFQEIGKILGVIAKRIDEDNTDRAEFRHILIKLLNKIRETYPGQLNFEIDLFWEANRNNWPSWTMDAFPRVYMPLEVKEKEVLRHACLIWQPIVGALCKTYSCKVERKLFDENVLQVVLPSAASQFIRDIAPIVEHKIMVMPYSSRRARVGVITDTMSEIELFLESTQPKIANKIRKTRKEILEKENVIQATA